MKNTEELNTLGTGIGNPDRKLAELNEDETAQVTGGENPFSIDEPSDNRQYEQHIYTIETEESAKKKFLGN